MPISLSIVKMDVLVGIAVNRRQSEKEFGDDKVYYNHHTSLKTDSRKSETFFVIVLENALIFRRRRDE